MDSVVGFYYCYFNGEIDLIMLISFVVKFDDYGVGWLVYGFDSVYCLIVIDGEFIVFYLLFSGEIEFIC